jgi:hypothetical protein
VVVVVVLPVFSSGGVIDDLDISGSGTEGKKKETEKRSKVALFRRKGARFH